MRPVQWLPGKFDRNWGQFQLFLMCDPWCLNLDKITQILLPIHKFYLGYSNSCIPYIWLSMNKLLTRSAWSASLIFKFCQYTHSSYRYPLFMFKLTPRSPCWTQIELTRKPPIVLGSWESEIAVVFLVRRSQQGGMASKSKWIQRRLVIKSHQDNVSDSGHCIKK